MHLHKINIAIFASGAGSNAKKIIEASFANDVHYKVALIVCNKPNAGVLQIAKDFSLPTLKLEKDSFFNSDIYIYFLQQHKIELIVLAGFLWKIPNSLITAFPNKIINIHPALLPKYGGKGMYGHFVHEAVLANHEKESGITIHWVNEVYDAGEIIFQEKVALDKIDNPDTLAQKIHKLEHLHYWKVIEKESEKLLEKGGL
jgi:phosphoribosylglycinamide formyltransferase 1